MIVSDEDASNEIVGDVQFPGQWTVFAPFAQHDETLPEKVLMAIPDTLTVGGATLKPTRVTPTLNQFDFCPFFGIPHQTETLGKTAYVFIPLIATEAKRITLGLGGDCWLEAWLNGEQIVGGDGKENHCFPPSISDQMLTVTFRGGQNVLAVRLVAGKGRSILALGGPRELRIGDFRSILSDPFNTDKRWRSATLTVNPSGKAAVTIGSRRELFIDEFLLDGLSGDAERRLHHPVPQEIVFQAGQHGKPWEGNIGYPAMVEEENRIRMYYSGRPAVIVDRSKDQFTCVAESDDGIHFTRPTLGLYEFNESKENNIIWHGAAAHNFTPFKDSNPDAKVDQRYKAIAYHPQKGLGAYGSADGIHWRLIADEPIITKGGFDSQNLAFWDSLRGLYVCFLRDNTGGLRRIATCTSKDFILWTEPILVRYSDDREEEMYTNGILPYARAPHLYIGTPARFVGQRRKVLAHPHHGVSDAILISSRDGVSFERWEEGFIRPGSECETWTDRNNFPVWGMLQLTPDTLSLYWNEHYRHPGIRLRRGTIRTDGFVSIHAGGGVGEVLTRPLIFSGNRLEVNYATSAIGALRFALCDEAGAPLPGFGLNDSEVLYGNEIAHRVDWFPESDLGKLAGRPIRIRARLHDADWYSFRFREDERVESGERQVVRKG